MELAEDKLHRNIADLEQKIASVDKDNERLRQEKSESARVAQENSKEKGSYTKAEHMAILQDYREQCVKALDKANKDHADKADEYERALEAAEEELSQQDKDHKKTPPPPATARDRSTYVDRPF